MFTAFPFSGVQNSATSARPDLAAVFDQLKQGLKKGLQNN
jgi:hypothetical protein